MRLRPCFVLLLLPLACGPSQSELKHHDDLSREFQTACPTGPTLQGIDVSSYQGNINWGQVAGSGIAWAYAKATEGTGFQDVTFPGNWSGMKAAGVKRGAYHFFHPGIDGTLQANYFLNYVGPIGAGDLPPMLDWEVSDGVSGATASANARAFINTIIARTGKVTVIYTSPGLWSGFGASGFGGQPLWVANYFNCYCNSAGVCPNTPSGWTNWVMWQYSDRAPIPGISGNVDKDEFNGDLAALDAFAGGSSAAVVLPRIRRDVGPDLDGDGKADVCGRGGSTVRCWLSTGASFPTYVPGPPLADSAGWSQVQYWETLQFADVTGDGKSDACARGPGGFLCWPSTGTAFGASFAGPPLSDASGWDKPEYDTTLQLGDLDGDGKADLCGRSAAGMQCWPSTGSGFGAAITGPAWSDAAGWDKPERYSTIQLADINGDGRADLCARSAQGIECALSTGNGFSALFSGPALSDVGGWNKPEYFSTIQFADINGDGKADLCARAAAGILCWLSDGSGFPTQVNGPAWSDAAGWNKPESFSTIQFADINGDGRADVCGRSAAGIECWLSSGTSFSTEVIGPALSNAASWNRAEYFATIGFGDIDGDQKADVCGRSAAGFECWLSSGNSFASSPSTQADYADSVGWNAPQYFDTLRLIGGRPIVPGTTSSTSGSSGTAGSSSTTGSSSVSTGSSSSTTGSSSSTTGSSSSTTGSSSSTTGSSSSTTGSSSVSTGSSSVSTGSSGSTSSTSGGNMGSAAAGGSGGSLASKGALVHGGCGSTGLELSPLALLGLFALRRRRSAR
jgi:GH25 family lysozyme M1 (1,4-beta-N-acetylmuramidase)